MSIRNGKPKKKLIIVAIVAGVAIIVAVVYAWKTGMIAKLKSKFTSKAQAVSMPEVTPGGNAPEMPEVS